MSFENRWMVVGRLTTQSPLHVGSGDTTRRERTHPRPLINEGTGDPVEINAVCTDAASRPIIPGPTLKGNLRSRARQAGLSPASFDALFGSEDAEGTLSVGGKVEFYDATADPGDQGPAFGDDGEPPYWDAGRLTGVAAGVAIDRRTRTAGEERLFHHEYVPPGVSFVTRLTGQDLSDDELGDLLFLLEDFNRGRLALGAGEADGWGSVSWELTDLRRITRDEVAGWVASAAPKVGYDALAPLPEAERRAWTDRARSRAFPAGGSSGLRLAVTLNFQSHFLVNDPSRTGSVEEGLPAHAPLRDTSGCPLLPASSLRGALRSQAEKILRSIHGSQAACYPGGRGPRPACGAVYEVGDVARLCPACIVFGAPGWRSPLRVSDFRDNTTGGGGPVTQEFLAIDRFTGGGAPGAKFNALAFYRPRLSGTVDLDLSALERAGAGRWALGLLTLALRDLIEGDVRLGFGAAKGYGAVTAEVSVAELPGWDCCPDLLKSDLPEDQWLPTWFDSMSDDLLKTVMQLWVMELTEMEPSPAPQEAKP